MPYRRTVTEIVLTPYAAWLEARALAVEHSARILYQELRSNTATQAV
jgi:hypothetical protein